MGWRGASVGSVGNKEQDSRQERGGGEVGGSAGWRVSREGEGEGTGGEAMGGAGEDLEV